MANKVKPKPILVGKAPVGYRRKVKEGIHKKLVKQNKKHDIGQLLYDTLHIWSSICFGESLHKKDSSKEPSYRGMANSLIMGSTP